jgi:hypothetical protein
MHTRRALALLVLACSANTFADTPVPSNDGDVRSREVISVRDFGAAGDGLADDTAALQAAIDAVKPGAAVLNSAAYGSRTGRVFIPMGRYRVHKPLQVYSGVWLDGAGYGSTLEASGDFPAGAPMVKVSTEGLSPQGYGGCTLTNLHLKARGGTGIWAFSHAEMKSAATVRVENLWIETPKGLDLTPYSQNSWVKNVLFTGAVDQMLRLRGNFNTFEQLDKEGGTGETSDPYIQIEGHTAGASASNHFRSILIEQVTSANKVLISAVGAAELVLEDVWLEPTKTNGIGVLLERCTDFHIRGHFAHLGSWGKLAVRDGSWGSIETLNADGEDFRWERYFEVDRTSFVRTGTVFSRRSENADPVDKSSQTEHGVIIDRMLWAAPRPGISPISRPRNLVVQNLLANPSFEQGDFRWSVPTGFAIREFIPAEVGPGRMLHLGGGEGAAPVTQEIDVPASWVGHSMTVSFEGRVSGQGFLAPFAKGAGIDLGQGSFHISEGDGWVLAAVTFQPLAAGRLAVGAWVARTSRSSDAYLDEFRLAFGSEGIPAGGQFQDLVLGGTNLRTGSAPPTSGTWKQGDFVLNDGQIAGGPLGWRAASGGSPGAWEAVPVPLRGTVDVDAVTVDAHDCVDTELPVQAARPGAECAPGASPAPPPRTIIACSVVQPERVMIRMCNMGDQRTTTRHIRLSARVFDP